MDYIYAVRYRSPRFDGWKEVKTKTLDAALRLAKIASWDLIKGEMVSVSHIPTGTLLCYVVDRHVA